MVLDRVYIGRNGSMARTAARSKHKHYVLDATKIKRAQQLLGVTTETETIERALDEVITERERTRAAWQAHRRLLASGVRIRDVYGVLDLEA